MSLDLTKPEKDTIAELINEANETTFTGDELIIAAPEPWHERGRNSQASVSLVGAIDPLEKISVYYSRLDLGVFFRDPPTIANNLFANTQDFIPALNALSPLGLTASDIVSTPIDTTTGLPKAFVVKVTNTSLRYIGQFSVIVN